MSVRISALQKSSPSTPIALGLPKKKNKNKKEEYQIMIFDFTWCVRKLRCYGDVMHSFDWKSAIEQNGDV